MANAKRKLYESNKLGFVLMLIHIGLNVIFTIYVLNNMATNFEIGVFVVITIVLLLLGFLTAVKVQNYSMPWGFVAILIGLFQFARLSFTHYELTGAASLVLTIIVIVSGVMAVASGIVSIRDTRIRQKCVKEYNSKNEYPIK